MSFQDIKKYTINREWKGETSLVIECGNGPICLCNKYKKYICILTCTLLTLILK